MLAMNIFTTFKYGLTGVFLLLDGIVYWAVGLMFSLYEALASAQIINQSQYQAIADKFYVVVGVVTLFYITYALLKSLINPDDLNKNVGKIAVNLVVSLILLGVVPLIFNYAFEIQDAIIDDDIIGNLVLGNTNSNSGSDRSISGRGSKMAVTVLKTFVNKEGEEIESDEGDLWGDFLTEAESDPQAFFKLTGFAEPIHDGDASYIPIVSTICGAFLVYVILSFCIDLGIRVAKLAFYQIIAPIPILLRIIPEKKSVFDNWVKGSIATYMEVFIRLFIMYIIVYLANLIFESDIFNSNVGLVGNVIIVLGLFAFAKQAPKLLGDVMGLDSGNIKLGIGGKLAAGGAFTAGALIGGGITAGMRNFTHYGADAVGAIKNKNWKGAAKSFGRAATSSLAGAVSGGVRSGKNAWSAKNYGDMRSAASKGAMNAVNARDDREKFKAAHSGIGEASKARIQGFGTRISNWATGGSSSILNKVKWEEQFRDLYSDYQSLYENAEYKAMDAELQKIKGIKAAGASTYEGQNIDNAVANLEAKMLEKRLDAIRENGQSAAYAMYNIAQMAKQNPNLAGSIGIDVGKAKDLELRGGEIIDSTTGSKISTDKLYNVIEGSALNGVTYDAASKKYRDSSGGELDFVITNATQKTIKDGMKDQKKKADTAAKSDRVSIEYKEAVKREEANKK